MKTLLLGELGSIGRRYASILNHFGYDWVGYDRDSVDYMVTPPDWDSIDRVIIATPTETHISLLKEVLHEGRPVLVEKPLSKNLIECQEVEANAKGMDAFVVCNYAYALRKFADRPYKITYANYRTGNDGLWWDVCQLLYLDPKAKIYNQTPYFMLGVNGKEVPYKEVEYSYIHMIHDFCDGKYSKLWTLEDGRKMTESVLRRENEGLSGGSGQNMVNEVTEKDL